MSEAKIRLSQKEMEMVIDPEWILTKNHILKKANHLLANLLAKQQEYVKKYEPGLPAEILQSSPKISKGENYKGLPYVVLDYPKNFSAPGILAIRTMFWWGNFFSVTLHLSGNYKKGPAEKLIASHGVLRENDYYCCVNDDPWEHHFEKDNYMALTEMSKSDFTELIREKPFIKLANKISLQSWDEAEETLLMYFKQMIALLTD